MDIAPFELERWFDEYEHDAEVMLAESGIRSLEASRFDTDPGELGYVIPTDGDPEFRAEIAGRYGRTAKEICFTCGTQEANYLVFRSLLDSESHAVVITPTYQALSAVPESICDVSRVSLSPPDWDLDLDAVREAIRPETTLIVLNNPNNPTGKYHSKERVEELYAIAAENNAYLLCDEVYRLLTDNPLPPVASLGEWGISTTSLTKAYGLAGLRFGWIGGSRELVGGAVRWKDYTTISPSLFGQHIARQALDEHEDEILEANRSLARKHHKMVEEWIREHDLSWHDPVGVNGFVTVPEGFSNGKSFCRTVLEKESVVLAPGEFFGFEERFRIGFGLSTAELTEGLERVGRVIEQDE
jgi:aspartate/methionine/tyrosine aminotransferase